MLKSTPSSENLVNAFPRALPLYSPGRHVSTLKEALALAMAEKKKNHLKATKGPVEERKQSPDRDRARCPGGFWLPLNR